MSYEQHVNEDARLVILKELTRQPNGTLNETLLSRVLDTFGHVRSREWLRTQLRAMADVGAVRINEAGSVMIAEITRAGIDHVERRAVVDGVARPSPGA